MTVTIFGVIVLVVPTLIIFLVPKSVANPADNGRRFSIFPIASGPLYNFPYDTKITERFLPFSATGKCEAGTVYNISHVDELLRKHFADLECIFHAGFAPSKVPEGVWFGKALGTLNTRLVTPLVTSISFWNGKIITKIDCDGYGQLGFYSFNNIFGLPIGPAMDYIGPITQTLAPGEYDDGRDALIVDYTADFGKACPNFAEYLKENFNSMPVKRRNLNQFFPVTLIYDALRFVGRQKDGGSILLGKSFLKDPFREDNQGATAAWWAVVNYDPEVNPEFHHGFALPPQEKSFRYMFPGIADLIARVLPIDNFLTSPMKTLGKLSNIGSNWFRSAFTYGREFLTSYRTFLRETMQFNRFFRNGRDGRKRVVTE